MWECNLLYIDVETLILSKSRIIIHVSYVNNANIDVFDNVNFLSSIELY